MKFYLTPEHGVVVDCYDTEIADRFDDFLTEERGKKFSLRFEKDKTTFFLPKQNSIEVIEGLLREFIQNFNRDQGS
jgi:hypothetical protein